MMLTAQIAMTVFALPALLALSTHMWRESCDLVQYSLSWLFSGASVGFFVLVWVVLPGSLS